MADKPSASATYALQARRKCLGSTGKSLLGCENHAAATMVRYLSIRRVLRSLCPWLAVLSLGLASVAFASHPESPRLLVDADQPMVSLDPYMAFLRDESAALTLEQVQQRQEGFVAAHQRRDLQLSYIQDVVWLRLELQSTASRPIERILQLEYAYLDRVTLYRVSAAGVEVLHAGATLPAAERAVRHRLPIFPLLLAPGEPVTLYLRVQAQGSMTLNSNLWQPQAFYENSDLSYLIMAAYYGMLLALGLYNLLLFFAIRQASFLLYALFVFSFGAAAVTFNGIGPLYLWPELGAPGNRILPVGFTLSATSAVLFTRAYLDTARFSPRWHRLLTVCTFVGGLATLAALLAPLQQALYLMSLFGILIAFMLILCGISCAVRRVPGARIFVVAWLLLLLGTSMLALRNFGLLPSNSATLYSIQIGSALEMLLLAFGLAARYNELKRQKEQAQQEMLQSLREQEVILERRVASRTLKLAEANRRLEDIATHDPLTGLPNRSGLAQHLRSAMLRTARRGETLALMMIDLDGFKLINDNYGHDLGDQLLKAVAERLSKVARSSDFVARFGGDEFIVIAEQMIDLAAAEALAERLRQAISAPIVLDGKQLSVGASVGISLSDGKAPEVGVLLQQADAAMYQQKNATKGSA